MERDEHVRAARDTKPPACRRRAPAAVVQQRSIIRCDELRPAVEPLAHEGGCAPGRREQQTDRRYVTTRFNSRACQSWSQSCSTCATGSRSLAGVAPSRAHASSVTHHEHDPIGPGCPDEGSNRPHAAVCCGWRRIPPGEVRRRQTRCRRNCPDIGRCSAARVHEGPGVPESFRAGGSGDLHEVRRAPATGYAQRSAPAGAPTRVAMPRTRSAAEARDRASAPAPSCAGEYGASPHGDQLAIDETDRVTNTVHLRKEVAEWSAETDDGRRRQASTVTSRAPPQVGRTTVRRRKQATGKSHRARGQHARTGRTAAPARETLRRLHSIER